MPTFCVKIEDDKGVKFVELIPHFRSMTHADTGERFDVFAFPVKVEGSIFYVVKGYKVLAVNTENPEDYRFIANEYSEWAKDKIFRVIKHWFRPDEYEKVNFTKPDAVKVTAVRPDLEYI